MPPRKKPRLDSIQSWLDKHQEIEVREYLLFCTLCKIDFKSKKYVDRHLSSKDHQIKLDTKKDFNLELTKFMTACHIPWNQLYNPVYKSFIEMCLRGDFPENTKVPSEANLRRQYLPELYKNKIRDIKNELRDAYIYLLVDETRDDSKLQIANVIVGSLSKDNVGKPHLISSKCLQTNQTISDVIIQALEGLWGIGHKNHEKLLLFLTDGETYMLKSGKYLQNVFPNMTHMTCLSHALNRVAEKICIIYPVVNRVIESVTKFFLKAPNRIELFKNMRPGVPLPPPPVPWLQAATYYAQHLDSIKIVINALNEKESNIIAEAKLALKNIHLEPELTFIANNYMCVQESITKLESASLSLKDSLAIVHNLQLVTSKLVIDERGKQVNEELRSQLQKNPGFDTMEKIQKLISGENITITDRNRISTIKYFPYLKYAPITSIEVERSISKLKWIYSARRGNLTSINLEKILIVYFETYIPH